ncbi:MAG: hypothetical protein UU73_C0002G0076 [Candidatus Daviesbacteria bacterium GW2011_GWA1_41_61]|uniref:Uncharacterized protein n=1 Tax=Candidatus Daviesbacteria bacterium GW2011_GWA2_40_9 TaxID=1618424 RepID=A0A0G0U122_9BACT|nr:MAG: hypothetical protein UU26_C0026G0005 [Candidatus Daviesbacteria bacterium GW2011_GWC1_40_9]KKR82803.1 MAG: hypothetical protein UU29_C0009G0074 [Candidatus Daviesbacteria bacterium GW2011_GWA2_40_9]KKR93736.1 MAG: hypothetical protein UU44_C0001G0076 [Candidatus Daviesbacteria bacterium GW2011_GWB1_41_15]KKS15202.1 MAG: hypothetical protein UU73_C0002G0076 [Candidatus Daviesbacteria bacterium GW2011_GWA1_41_61]
MNNVKEITRIIKTEPLSVLIFLSLIFIPYIISQWFKLFPKSWELFISIIVIILWIFALTRLRKEIQVWRRKTILVNYLKKEKRHSIHHLSKEWAAKKEFTEKNIEQLLLEFPDELKRVKMGKNKGPGVGLVSNAKEEQNNQ